MTGERLGGLGRGYERVWDDGIDTIYEQEWATENGQDDWAAELEADRRDQDWRLRVLQGGLR